MKNWILLMDRNKRLAAAFSLTLCLLLLFSCDSNGILKTNTTYAYKSFAYDLQGTWETNSISDYSGTLVIDNNAITISGYTPNTSYELTYGTSHRPFRDFTKGTPLEGYSQEGKIFIKDAGVVQEGLPYTYWDDDYKQVQFIRFDFGGRVETLRKQ